MAFTTKSILPVHTSKPDFNSDGFTDLIWRGADDALAVWNMSQDGLSGQSGLFVSNPGGGLVLKGIGDLVNDGTTDLVWQDQAGAIQTWAVRDNQVVVVTQLFRSSPTRPWPTSMAMAGSIPWWTAAMEYGSRE